MKKFVLINKNWYEVTKENDMFIYAYCFGIERTFLKYEYWGKKLRCKKEEFITKKELLTK